MSAITHTMFLQIGQRRYQVATFAQASEMFCKARDACGEPASKICSKPIVDESGSVIAHVSYNGRVWPGAQLGPRDWKPGVAPLYDPCPNKFTAKSEAA